MPYYDTHTHSDISPDGYSTAAEMWEVAKAIGLSGLCVTNHCDVIIAYDLPETGNFRATSPHSMEKYAKPNLKRWTAERSESVSEGLRHGIEVGSPYADRKRAAFVMAHVRPEFVIASIHPMRETHDFYYIKGTAPDLNALLSRYFDEMLEMAETCDFDVLGHLTYPWRYLHREGLNPDIWAFEERIRAIFRLLIEQGRGIEINTSGLRQPFGRCMPDFDIIKLFRDCGGEVLTIGSDAHRACDVGAGLKEGHALAQTAGFTRAAFFRDRKPVFYDL
jgi:histidinol-phosphatase (PHP family)